MMRWFHMEDDETAPVKKLRIKITNVRRGCMGSVPLPLLYKEELDWRIMGRNSDDNTFRAFMNALYNTVDAPVTYFREKVVEPNQKKYPWYHQKFRRVPTIDQCYDDDVVCDFEANYQFKRDRAVDSEILSILRQRYEDCMIYENPDHLKTCLPLWKKYKNAEEAWFIKYGDLGAYADARKCYMKQKHRMLWERRYGSLSSLTGDKQAPTEAN